jgi:iron complex transport system substrate-binding protein
MSDGLPKRIICLTEESVEFLYAIGEEERIIGVSSYAVRPEAVKAKPKVSVFTHAQTQKIVDMKPDLVLGYSDIQKDIARDLIAEGLNVWISNHRSLSEVLGYCRQLGGMLGRVDKTRELIDRLERKIDKTKNLVLKRPRLRVYLEEWDQPLICGIRYFSELVELCGGEVIHRQQSFHALGKNRILDSEFIIEQNPEVILACWCGKKVEIDSILTRQGWQEIEAIKMKQVVELPPEIFLQPGPALITDGIDQLLSLFGQFLEKKAGGT